MVWGVSIQVGVLGYEMGCSYTGWVFIYRLGYSYTGWGVSIQDGVLVYKMG